MTLRLYEVTLASGRQGWYRGMEKTRTVHVHARHNDDALAVARRIVGDSSARMVAIRPGNEPDGLPLGAMPKPPKPTRWGRAYARAAELKPPSARLLAVA